MSDPDESPRDDAAERPAQGQEAREHEATPQEISTDDPPDADDGWVDA
ncbi:MAG TPA: hypothetical protein VI076_03850 [Actinopolymorphaceae bacterium]